MIQCFVVWPPSLIRTPYPITGWGRAGQGTANPRLGSWAGVGKMRRTTRRGSSRGKDRAWWLKSPKMSTGFYPTEPNVAFDVLLSEQTYDWRPCENHTAHESGIDMSKRRKITNKVRMNEKKTQEGRREVMLVYGQGGDGNNRKDLGQGQCILIFIALLWCVCILWPIKYLYID